MGAFVLEASERQQFVLIEMYFINKIDTIHTSLGGRRQFRINFESSQSNSLHLLNDRPWLTL